MKSSGILVPLLVAVGVSAFVPHQASFGRRHGVVSMADDDAADVSIPYDAAARLAYDQWREQFSKGDFDEERYQVFKTNYEVVTITNVKAKQKARVSGTVSVSLMSLNEFGDLTQEEYQRLQETPPIAATSAAPTATEASVLGKAVEAAELQTAASAALMEAADALAEEEEVSTVD